MPEKNFKTSPILEKRLILFRSRKRTENRLQVMSFGRQSPLFPWKTHNNDQTEQSQSDKIDTTEKDIRGKRMKGRQ